MEQENKLKFAVLVKEPDENTKEVLIAIYGRDVEGGTAFVVKEDYADTYEDLMGLDFEIELGFLNEDDGLFYRSTELENQFKINEDVEDEPLDMTFLPEINDFVDGETNLIQQEQDRINNEYYAINVIESGSNDTVEDAVESSNVASSEDEPVDDLTSLLNAKMAEATSNVASDVPSVEDLVGHSVQPTEQPAVEYQTTTGNPYELEQEVQAQPTTNLETPQGKVDALLTLAADVFDNENQVSLPKYDEHTHTQLQSDIINAENVINDARDKAIFAIRDTFRANENNIIEKFDELYSDSKHTHEATLRTIENNEKVEIQDMKTKAEREYDEAKENFILSQHDSLAARYDTEHLSTHQAEIQQKEQGIRSNNEALIARENKQYEEHYEKEKERYLERNLRKIDLTEIFDNYNHIASEEKEALAKKATEFADQVAVVASTYEQQRNEAVEKQLAAERNAQFLNDTLNDRVQTEAQRIAEEKTQDLIIKNNELQNALTDTQSSIEEERTRTQKEKERAEALEQTNAQLKVAKEVLEKVEVKQVPAQPTVVQPAAYEPASFEPRKANKGNGGTIAIIATGAILALGGLGFGAYSISQSNKQPVTHEVMQQPTQASSSSSVSSSSSSQQEYRKGDKWTYHAPDGESYEVTMDSATKGHYTDKDNNVHELTFNE